MEKSSKQSKSSSNSKKIYGLHACKQSKFSLYLLVTISAHVAKPQPLIQWISIWLCSDLFFFSSQSDKNNHRNRCWKSNSARTSEGTIFFIPVNVPNSTSFSNRIRLRTRIGHGYCAFVFFFIRLKCNW